MRAGLTIRHRMPADGESSGASEATRRKDCGFKGMALTDRTLHRVYLCKGYRDMCE